MVQEAIKYENRDAALAAFKRMVQRKRDWMERTEKELKELRASYC